MFNFYRYLQEYMCKQGYLCQETIATSILKYEITEKDPLKSEIKAQIPIINPYCSMISTNATRQEKKAESF